MKKVLMIGFAALLAMGVLAIADTTNVVTNLIGQVTTVISGVDGVRAVTVTTPLQPASSTRVFVNGHCQFSASHNTVATQYTPRDIGDMLVGQLTHTGAVWVAVGFTTNEWTLLTSAVVVPVN